MSIDIENIVENIEENIEENIVDTNSEIKNIEDELKMYNDELKNNINSYIFTGNHTFLNEIEETNHYNFVQLLNRANTLKGDVENKIGIAYEDNKFDVDAVKLMSHSQLIEQYSKELNLSVPLKREIYYSSLREKIRMWMYIIGIVFLIVFIVKYMLKLKVGNNSLDKKDTKNTKDILKIENPFNKKSDIPTPTSSVDKEIVSPLKEGEL
tara:strand:+ start:63 stop:692 length:630 start_codon:yes stop_codon:yes gene_type:complete